MSRILVIGALLNLPLAAALSHYLGAIGAAIASVTTALAMTLAMAIILHRKRLAVWQIRPTIAADKNVRPNSYQQTV